MLFRFTSCILAALLVSIDVARATASQPALFDVTLMPIEELVETDFIPASRIARQISDAPSAVSIVTAQDIREYGYRTLSDILKSMRGLYLTTSLDYDYLGGRGFGEPGDYAGRIMLTIDGYVTNDNYFNQIFLGEDALVDVELIDRVEFIPGPGSTTYGNSAFLGVINIVTRSGADIDGAVAAFGAGNEGRRKERFTVGKRLSNGAEYLASASLYRDNGLSAKFPGLDGFATMSGDTFENQAIDFKKIHNRRLFFKGNYEGWAFELANVRQTTQDSTFLNWLEPMELGKFSPRTDDSAFASLKYDTDVGEHLKTSSHLYYGQYLYQLHDNNRAFPATYGTTGRWWGGDVKFIGSWFERHKWLFGAEYRSDYQQDAWSDDESGGYRVTNHANTISLYFQDEYRLNDQLTIVPGLRYDHNSVGGSALSPRMAAIYSPSSASLFKLSHGDAFRYANVNEGGASADTPYESVSTTELVWQQQLGKQSRLTVSMYRNKIADAINKSYQELETEGQEVGIERVTPDGFRLNASVAHQRSYTDQGEWLLNSPYWLGKLNIAQPILQGRAVAGFEVQMLGRRLGFGGVPVESNTVANLTVGSNRLLPDTYVSFTVRNLFDAYQEDVLRGTGGTLPRQGRDVWLQLEYNLK